jgi:hypothetical protein
MTDPFKNQRYSSNSSMLNNNNDETSSNFSQQFRQASLNNKVEIDENERSLKQQDAFMLAHVQSNKELIKQLKSNIELLFKGTIIVGRLVFYPFSALRWQCQVNKIIKKFTRFNLLFNWKMN